MHANRLPVPTLVRGALTIAAGLALLLGGAVQPAAANSSVPGPVALGTHRFGHLRAADSIVAALERYSASMIAPTTAPIGRPDAVARGRLVARHVSTYRVAQPRRRVRRRPKGLGRPRSGDGGWRRR